MTTVHEIVELKAIFKGRVQGVGFRASVYNQAKKLEIVGSVKNHTDGSVEMVAQGTRPLLERLLIEIKNHSWPAQILSVDTLWQIPKNIFVNFEITR